MTPKWYKFIFLTILFFVILASYGNQLIYRYAVPPGYDGIVHAQIIQNILNGDYWQIVSYHSLWHLFSIPFIQAFSTTPLITLAWLNPLLLVTMAISMAHFAKRAFGPIAGLAALILMGFFSLQPLQTLTDGGYPNVLAAGTILPIFLLFVHRFVSTKMQWWYVLALLLGFTIMIWSHHLTTLYAVPISVTFIILIFARNLLQKKVPLFIIGGTLIALAAMTIGGTWYILHSAPTLSVTRLAEQFVRVDTLWPFFHLINGLYSPDAILPLQLYPRDIGYVIIYGGILAFTWATWRAFVTPHHPKSNFYVLLVIWTSVLFVASRMESLGFPVRLARDLAIPLTLLCAGALADLFTIALKLKHNLGAIVIAVVALGILYVGRNTLVYRYHMISDPNVQVHHLEVDTKAAHYITNNLPTSSRIGLFQESLYVDLFTPNHVITWITDATERQHLINYTSPEKTLANYDYLYFEHRSGKNTPDDNPELLQYYLDLSLVSEIAAFRQPEKIVYLFKINHPIVTLKLQNLLQASSTTMQIAATE